MLKTPIRFFLAATVVMAGLAAHRSVQALSLVPPSLEFRVGPGEVVTDQIKLYNEEEQTLTVTSSTANFGAKNETGQPVFYFDAPTADLSSWIKLEAAPLTIKPGDRVTVPFTISVPKNAEPGGHYAGIFFDSGAPTSGQVGIQSKLGALVILSVTGDIRESATLAEIGIANGQTKFSRLPTSFFARVQNNGNVHLRPAGNITVTNMFGKKTAIIPVNEAKGAVLPASTRRFEETWTKNNDGVSSGGFWSEIRAEWRNFALGSYTATYALTYGQTAQNLTGSLSFTVFPWRLLLVELLVLAVVVTLLVIGIRRYNRAIIRRAQSKQSTPPTNHP